MAVCVAVVVLGLIAVIQIGDEVLESEWPATLDPTVGAWFVSIRTPFLTALATAATFSGGLIAIGSLAVLSIIIALLARHPTAALTIAITMAVAGATTLVVKQAIGRPRPSVDEVLGVPDPQFSWPSGHTFNSTVFYGLLAGFVILATSRALLRALAIGAWLVLTVAIGASRLYLGYHWLTDVVAGFLLGLVVLALVAIIHEATIRRSHRIQDLDDESRSGSPARPRTQGGTR